MKHPHISVHFKSKVVLCIGMYNFNILEASSVIFAFYLSNCSVYENIIFSPLYTPHSLINPWQFSYAITLETMLCSVQFSSVDQSCPTLCNPMNRSTPGLPVHHQLPEFTQTHAIESVMPSSHLILCHPLLLLPPIPPSIRVFSNESTLLMRWPKYWSFSFSIIPSKEHPGLISFRMDLSRLYLKRK